MLAIFRLHEKECVEGRGETSSSPTGPNADQLTSADFYDMGSHQPHGTVRYAA